MFLQSKEKYVEFEEKNTDIKICENITLNTCKSKQNQT